MVGVYRGKGGSSEGDLLSLSLALLLLHLQPHCAHPHLLIDPLPLISVAPAIATAATAIVVDVVIGTTTVIFNATVVSAAPTVYSAVAAVRTPPLALTGPSFVSTHYVLSLSSLCDTNTCKRIISNLIIYFELIFL